MATLTLEEQAINLERLLDLIAEALIVSGYVDSSKVTDAQKFIRNGQLQQGAGEGVLALFQKDIKANQEDLVNSATVSNGETSTQENLQEIANNVDFDSLSIVVSVDGEISISGGGTSYDTLSLTNLLTDVSTNNPLNVSQFIPLSRQQSNVNVEKAEEYLDTNIYELLPTGDSRQARITRFFQELNALLPTNSPNFGNIVQRLEGTEDWVGGEEYSRNNSISYAQDNTDGNIDEEDAFLNRLKSESIDNSDSLSNPNSTNATKTIEDIYNRITPFLRDILEEPPTTSDDRPEYKNQSNGYLQFRNLNQGIIIRNTNQEFVEGLNPDTQDYLDTGFTISMWVRFLDKTSEGTLFNFGNPTRGESPFGFKLETYVVNSTDEFGGNSADGDSWATYGDYATAQNVVTKDTNELFFTNSNTERFVQLVVRDGDNLRDSHTGMSWTGGYARQVNIPEGASPLAGKFTTTRIPEDFNEWYFICATFNYEIDEDDSFTQGFNNTPDFWMNNVNPITDDIVSNSGYGNKCKVEIISRSDLLRARGFRV